jgi:hypothetical protein
VIPCWCGSRVRSSFILMTVSRVNLSVTFQRKISALDGTVLLDYTIRWNLQATESIRSALNY